MGVGNKWVLYAKGGNYRKWWGNLDYVIDWSKDATTYYKKNHSARIVPEYLRFKKGITWTLLSSSKTGFRVLPEFATFDMTGSSIFLKEENRIEEILSLLNSKVATFVLGIFSETYAYQIREIRQVPIVDFNTAIGVACNNIQRLNGSRGKNQMFSKEMN